MLDHDDDVNGYDLDDGDYDEGFIQAPDHDGGDCLYCGAPLEECDYTDLFGNPLRGPTF